MVGLHIQYAAHIDFSDAHAGAQQAAARGLQYGDIDLRVREHHACRHRARHIALHRALAVDVDPVRGGQPRRMAAHFGEVGEHARRGGFAVGAGDRRNRNARRGARREQHADHRSGDVAPLAFARCHMHAKAGCGVDFADAAADRAVAFRNVLRQKIDAAHVQADGAHRALRHLAVIGVDDVGDVGCGAAGGKICRGTQIDDLARTRNRIGLQTHPLEHFQRLRVELQTRQYLFMTHPAARILIHDVDQLQRSCAGRRRRHGPACVVLRRPVRR